jgi:hypothetical protein
LLACALGLSLFFTACDPRKDVSNGEVVPEALYGDGTRGWMRLSAKLNGNNIGIDPCELLDTTYFSANGRGRIAPYLTANCDSAITREFSIPFNWRLENNNRLLVMDLDEVFPISDNPSDTLQIVNLNELTSEKLRISYDIIGQSRFEVTWRPIN